jgi:hypothetical protein
VPAGQRGHQRGCDGGLAVSGDEQSTRRTAGGQPQRAGLTGQLGHLPHLRPRGGDSAQQAAVVAGDQPRGIVEQVRVDVRVDVRIDVVVDGGLPAR